MRTRTLHFNQRSTIKTLYHIRAKYLNLYSVYMINTYVYVTTLRYFVKRYKLRYIFCKLQSTSLM